MATLLFATSCRRIVVKLNRLTAASALILVFAVAPPSHTVATPTGLPAGNPAAEQSAEPAGVDPLRTDKTIPYWRGQFTDPTNGRTYGYHMVGADPRLGADTTIPVDIVPVNITFDANPGVELNGTDVVQRVIASPIFAANDYTSTPGVIVADDPFGLGLPVHNPGGALSAGNTHAQYLDALMRVEFNAVGTSYHLRLGTPNVLPALHVHVPQKQGSVGTLRHEPIGLIGGWYWDKVQNWLASEPLDPTHLVIFLTNNVYGGIVLSNCCVGGFHGAAKSTGPLSGPLKAAGQQKLQTYIVAAYMPPGAFDLTQDWFEPDVGILSHEIAEWANDPFTTNDVTPWATPIYGCRNLLEVGDPAFGVGFELPGNSYDSGPGADGMWHLQDQVLLPWMSREAPNLTSQPTQLPSPNVGRFSFLGDLAPYPILRGPAPSC